MLLLGEAQMALSLAITATEEERLLTQTIEAMFGAQAGYAILKSIAADAEISGVDAVANGLVSFADNTATAETFAASIVANLGITVESTGSTAAVTDAVDFVAAQLNTAGEANWGAAVLAITTLFAGLEDDATYGAAATAYNVSVIESLNYSLDEANQAPYYGPADSGEFNLTTGLDSLMGTVGDDSFIARIVDNANTAQSADVIDGGEGNDTLTADIGNSQAFAITLETNSVENFVVRTQANAIDSNQNNMPNSVQIDAERMVGTDRYELNNGRADLIIEDVRIERAEAYGDDANQITKDITVAMVSTDPGDVDFGLYFDPASLVSQGDTQSGATLQLNLMSIEEVAKGNDPLTESPFTQVTFVLDGTTFFIDLNPTDLTYADLLVTVNAGLDALKLAADATSPIHGVTADLNGTFIGTQSGSGTQFTGQTILLTNSGSAEFAEGAWLAAKTVPADSEFVQQQSLVQPDTTGSLITSTIILDDVGSGSNGGALVVGSMSTGETSNSQGVEQFDLLVDRDSRLTTINSTNNTLRVVTIVNQDNNDDTNLTADGSLWAGGLRDAAGNPIFGNTLPGDDAQDNDFGFSDVRVIDAATMVGEVHLTAELTEAVTAKFMDRVDVDGNPRADNVANGDFNYTMGTVNDSLELTVSSANLAAAGTTTREDFTLNIDGGTGDDALTTMIGDGSGLATDNWYVNSKLNANLNVNGGAGDDAINTFGAGDVVIDAGAGNDTIYTDNSGIGAVVTTSGAPVLAVTDGVDGTASVYTLDLSGVSVSTTGGVDTVTIAGVLAYTATADGELAAVVAAGMDGTSITIAGVVYDIDGTNPAAVVLTSQTAQAVGAGALVVATTNGGGGANVNPTSTIVAQGALGAQGTAETFVATYTDGVVGQTIIFDGVTTTLVDTDISGTVTAAEVATQVAAAHVAATTYTTTVSVGDTVTFTSTVAATALVQNVTNVTDVIGAGSYTGTASTAAATTAATWVVNALAGQEEITNIQSEANTSVVLANATVTVNYNGLVSAVTLTDDYMTSMLDIHQATKDAINNDAVLNKLLVAQDGPANTLVITSLVDGVQIVTDLDITVTAPTVLSATDLAAFNVGHTANGFTAVTDVAALALMAAGTATLDAAAAPVLALSGGADMAGTDSIATNDNTITGGAGDDVIVLSTDANDTSNEVIVLSGSFGTDTIVNFDGATVSVNTNGQDQFDVSAYMDLGVTNGVIDTQITVAAGLAMGAIDNQVLLTTGGALNVAPVITATDDALNVQALVFATHILDASGNPTDLNVANVYTAIETGDSATTTGTVAVTLVGTVDMDNVAIAGLTIADFVLL